MPTIKLHAHLAQLGVASRRKAEAMIEAGKVAVNGQPAHVGQRIDPNIDHVKIGGKPISGNLNLRYFLINKPRGFVSTTSDELDRPTVLKLIPKTKERLFPVGRLDIDSEGLLLLTNDGDLTYRLTHPKFAVPKTYEVMVGGRPTGLAINHLRRGVKLKEGYTQPAEITILDHEGENTWLEITITEGWNRQVRRMLERVGYDTIRLVRIKMGPFSLDDLDDNPYRELTGAEVETLASSLSSLHT
jgi:23S rRNA pseudouridine2605 synthase